MVKFKHMGDGMQTVFECSDLVLDYELILQIGASGAPNQTPLCMIVSATNSI